MNIGDAFALNRKVFERLTGLQKSNNVAGKNLFEDSAFEHAHAKSKKFDVPVYTLNQSKSSDFDSSSQSDRSSSETQDYSHLHDFEATRTNAETPVFSLRQGDFKHVDRRQTGMALSFEAPANIDYPTLQKSSTKQNPDPLESLYYQLEVEARRSSQLLSEEEF